MNIKLKHLILILTIIFRYVQFYNIVSNNSMLCYIFVIIILSLSVIEMFFLQFNKKMFISVFIMLLISLILFIYDTDDNLLLYSLIALTFIDDDNQDLIRTFFITSLVMYIVTILLNKVGLITSHDSMRDKDIATSIRYSLGFGHVNSVFLYYLPIIYSGYYIYGKKKIYKLLVLISSTILFVISNCRTGYIFALLFIILTKVKRKNIQKYLKVIMKYLFILLTIISIIFVILYGSTKYNKLNELLSFRLSNAYSYISKGYLISLTGINIDKMCALDNLYINLLVRLGLFAYIFYFYIYYKGLSLIKDERLIMIALLYLLYGLSEASTTSNFMLIILIKEIFINFRKEEKHANN